jgi:chromosome segregation ATPase
MSRTVLAPVPAGASGAGHHAHDPQAQQKHGLPDTLDGTEPRRNMPSRSRVGWLVGSIGYIYVYLREKVDAGERRRRLIEERDGAERLLGGAVKALGVTILAQGIQHPDLTGLLEAIGRAEARREAAVADIGASEKLQTAEEARLGAQEAACEAESTASDRASHEADELIRGVSRDNQETAARLSRARDARARLERDAEAADATPDGREKAANLRHEAAGKQSEETTLEVQVARLDAQLAEMRERSATLRIEAQAAHAKLEAAGTMRRSAGSAMKASIAGHARQRVDAAREVAELTDQLGRAATQARSTDPLLGPMYQSIDRLEETMSDRAQQIASLDLARDHYDIKKLVTGVGLLTSLVALTAAVLWFALKR